MSDKDVIIRLKGGLGNQMFQYAFGRAYSLRHNLNLKLDVTDYPRQNLRAYSLSHFNILENIASEQEVKKKKYPYGFFSKLRRGFNQKILRRFYIGYEDYLIDKKMEYIDGFFQSEKYFLNIRDLLLKEFTLKKPMSEGARNAMEFIRAKKTTVSVHVRRGDYTKDWKTLLRHMSCSLEYYRQASQIILAKYPDAEFLFFSDDIEWVKNNIKFNNPCHYLSSPDIKDYEEIIIMSHCQHHIIVNSSFSWWGAWLDLNPSKIVVAPTTWRRNDIGKWRDIIPETWIQVPNQPKS